MEKKTDDAMYWALIEILTSIVTIRIAQEAIEISDQDK